LGSVIAVTDASGAVLGSYAYEPFGSLRQSTGSLTTPSTFTGRPLDAESGLLFLRHRYYDARIGTFLTPDPIGIKGGINFYRYVGNNPMNLLDPFGYQELQKQQGAGIGLKIAFGSIAAAELFHVGDILIGAGYSVIYMGPGGTFSGLVFVSGGLVAYGTGGFILYAITSQ